MIAYVRGTISHIFTDCCFVDVQGVGYRVFIAESTKRKLSVGAVSSLYTYMHVREDALLLYGFYSQDEYDAFLHLVSINGIGPKVALGILSVADPNQLCLAVSQKNVAFLTKIPGIGKKTAERIILELKDKFSITGSDLGESQEPIPGQSASSDMADEAIQALLALGYTQNEIMPVLKKIRTEADNVENMIKIALRELSRR